MTRGRLIAVVLVLLGGGVAIGAYLLLSGKPGEATGGAQAEDGVQDEGGAQAEGASESGAAGSEDGDRQAELAAIVDKLGAESAELMPAALEGVALGMPRSALERVRPEVAPADPGRGREGIFLEETLPNQAQVIYGLSVRSGRLVQVQVMSKLPDAAALEPHLAAMNERYGSPTGVWRCPDTGGVPTLRFTWRGNITTVSDVLLIHPGGVSVTLYIAPSERIHESLRRGACRPTSREDLLASPPIAMPEQLRKKGAGGR